MKARPILYSLFWLAFWTFALSVFFKGFLGIPGIPYNVQEIMGARFSTPQIILLAFTFIWIGLGSAIVARLIGSGPRSFWKLPLFTILTGLVSFLLLDAAVSGESIRDIVGSPTIWRDIVTNTTLGGDAASIISTTASPYTVNQLEYAGRYVALYSPIILMLAAINAGWTLPGPIDSMTRWRRSSQILAYALPWLFLCRTIVINWAGTDNITELIEPEGLLGLGGEPLLFLLIFLIALCASWLVRAAYGNWRHWLIAIFLIIMATPVSWFLLKNGLAAHLPKYGPSVSGVDFLLGPDRKVILPEIQLQLRWAVVFFSAILIIALGLASVPHRNR